LNVIDELTLNDFYGMFRMLREIEERRKEGSPVSHTRDATKKELSFIERYQEIKKKRDK